LYRASTIQCAWFLDVKAHRGCAVTPGMFDTAALRNHVCVLEKIAA
jgi:hypothetical protein